MKRRRIRPVRFHWTDWNREKVARHGLSTHEVEFAWRRGLRPPDEARGCRETFGRIPSGRLIKIVWKYVEVFEALEPGHLGRAVFVITAF